MDTWKLNKDQKIEISLGAVEYLVKEVEQNRKQIEILSAENGVMNNFFSLINRLEGKPSRGYGEDRFYTAKKEFSEVIEKLTDKSAES